MVSCPFGQDKEYELLQFGNIYVNEMIELVFVNRDHRSANMCVMEFPKYAKKLEQCGYLLWIERLNEESVELQNSSVSLQTALDDQVLEECTHNTN